MHSSRSDDGVIRVYDAGFVTSRVLNRNVKVAIYSALASHGSSSFPARRSCRRCAFHASYNSVGNAGSIDVTTSDIPLRTDSIKRCKG
jgi:hypothetical protein